MKNKTTVTLRTQRLKDGRESYFIETYLNGDRTRRSIGIYLLPGRGKEVRDANTQSKYLAEQIFKKEQERCRNIDLGLDSNDKGLDMRFFDFFKKCADACPTERTVASWYTALNYLSKYEKRDNITFRYITHDWIEGYREFLLSTNTINLKRIDSPEGVEKPLSHNSASTMFAKLLACIKKAYESRLIPVNPALGIKSIPINETERVFLTEDELKALIAHPYVNRDIMMGFLFSCFTGLRYSDVRALTWGKVSSDGGRIRIATQMKKTGAWVYQIISEQAVACMGTPSDDPGKRVFEQLPNNDICNRGLQEWAKSAGIEKRLHFHSGRHTTAVLLLSNGVDIYTLSGILGHKSIATTQIYAKIVDETKKAAVDSFPKIL